MLRVLVVLPALAALAGLATRRSVHLSRAIAVGATGLTLVVAVGALTGLIDVTGRTALAPSPDAGELRIPLHLTGSNPALLIATVVALVGFAVQVYAVWYLADDDRYPVFAATVSLFVAAMLLLVLSSDLVLTLIGWEVMGWCSYLLIGHWSRRESARRAAHKAFLVTRLADVGFVLGVVILAAGAGSTAYEHVIPYWTGNQPCTDAAAVASCAAPSQGLLNLALVLLIIGILGKSAQFPFQDWLPDAMEGPTPASALIHAATMVAAGTFVLAALFPLLAESGPARVVLAVSVAITMVGSALTAFGQSDLKRLLAWSTVSQVAVMLSALAAAPAEEGPGAGVFHLYAHAFFKALLFLVIGWLAILGGGTAAARLRGTAHQSMPAQVAFGAGLLALAGFPFVVGGMSKEHVVVAAYEGWRQGVPGALLVFVALLVTVVLTAAYAMRAWLVVTTPPHLPPAPDSPLFPETPLVHPVSGNNGDSADTPLFPFAGETTGDLGNNGEDEGEHARQGDHANAPGPAVRGVVGALLVGTVFGALVLFTPWLDLHGGFSIPMLALTVGLALVGAVVAWRLSMEPNPAPNAPVARVDPAQRLLGGRMALFDSGFGFDGLYRQVVVRPVLALAAFVADIDDRVVDATALSAAKGTGRLGRLGVRAHQAERPATGLAWVGLAAVVLGAVGVLVWR